MYYCKIIYFKQIFADGNNANNINENSNVNFCSNKTNLISNKLKVTDFVESVLQEYSTYFIPPCHNIAYKLVKNFVITRIYFLLKKECNDIVKAAIKSSRSVVIKISISNEKH